MKQNTTEMTKAELLELINDKNTVIADLNARMDELESMAVVSRAEILDADTSRLLSTMNARIKALEEKLEA